MSLRSCGAMLERMAVSGVATGSPPRCVDRLERRPAATGILQSVEWQQVLHSHRPVRETTGSTVALALSTGPTGRSAPWGRAACGSATRSRSARPSLSECRRSCAVDAALPCERLVVARAVVVERNAGVRRAGRAAPASAPRGSRAWGISSPPPAPKTIRGWAARSDPVLGVGIES